jgi:hypothetical protein
MTSTREIPAAVTSHERLLKLGTGRPLVFTRIGKGLRGTSTMKIPSAWQWVPCKYGVEAQSFFTQPRLMVMVPLSWVIRGVIRDNI